MTSSISANKTMVRKGLADEEKLCRKIAKRNVIPPRSIDKNYISVEPSGLPE